MLLRIFSILKLVRKPLSRLVLIVDYDYSFGNAFFDFLFFLLQNVLILKRVCVRLSPSVCVSIQTLVSSLLKCFSIMVLVSSLSFDRFSILMLVSKVPFFDAFRFMLYFILQILKYTLIRVSKFRFEAFSGLCLVIRL